MKIIHKNDSFLKEITYQIEEKDDPFLVGYFVHFKRDYLPNNEDIKWFTTCILESPNHKHIYAGVAIQSPNETQENTQTGKRIALKRACESANSDSYFASLLYKVIWHSIRQFNYEQNKQENTNE